MWNIFVVGLHRASRIDPGMKKFAAVFMGVTKFLIVQCKDRHSVSSTTSCNITPSFSVITRESSARNVLFINATFGEIFSFLVSPTP
jgi:hypothetical protein